MVEVALKHSSSTFKSIHPLAPNARVGISQTFAFERCKNHVHSAARREERREGERREEKERGLEEGESVEEERGPVRLRIAIGATQYTPTRPSQVLLPLGIQCHPNSASDWISLDSDRLESNVIQTQMSVWISLDSDCTAHADTIHTLLKCPPKYILPLNAHDSYSAQMRMFGKCQPMHWVQVGELT